MAWAPFFKAALNQVELESFGGLSLPSHDGLSDSKALGLPESIAERPGSTCKCHGEAAHHGMMMENQENDQVPELEDFSTFS